MSWRMAIILWFSSIIVTGCGPIEPPDYYLGREEGKKAARQAMQEHPYSARFLNAITPTSGLGRAEKSRDWNAGFQAGWTKEFDK